MPTSRNDSLPAEIGPYLNAVHQSMLLQDFGNMITLRNYNQDGLEAAPGTPPLTKRG